MEKLGWNEGQFYCHKGVPITPGQGEGFAYPHDRRDKPDIKRLRLCRGYLNWLGGREPRARLASQIAAFEAGQSAEAIAASRWADDGGRVPA